MGQSFGPNNVPITNHAHTHMLGVSPYLSKCVDQLIEHVERNLQYQLKDQTDLDLEDVRPYYWKDVDAGGVDDAISSVC